MTFFLKKIGYLVLYCFFFFSIASKVISLKSLTLNLKENDIDHILKSHQETLEIIILFNATFSGTISCTVIYNVTFMCVGIFEGLDLVGFISMISSLTEIFLICYSGQLITNKYEDLEKAIYSCDWTDFNNESKKKILTMLTMTQNMDAISAGPIKLNFETFKDILYFIYRVVTVLI